MAFDGYVSGHLKNLKFWIFFRLLRWKRGFLSCWAGKRGLRFRFWILILFSRHRRPCYKWRHYKFDKKLTTEILHSGVLAQDGPEPNLMNRSWGENSSITNSYRLQRAQKILRAMVVRWGRLVSIGRVMVKPNLIMFWLRLMAEAKVNVYLTRLTVSTVAVIPIVHETLYCNHDHHFVSAIIVQNVVVPVG